MAAVLEGRFKHYGVVEERNYDLHMDTSRITEDKKGLDNNFSRGTKICAEYNDSCRDTKIRSKHNNCCRSKKSRAEYNRLETQSCRGTNSPTTHSRLGTYSRISPPTHTKAKYHQPHRAVTHQERGAPEPPRSGLFDFLRPPEEATGERKTGN